jgi:hypothetical protein
LSEKRARQLGLPEATSKDNDCPYGYVLAAAYDFSKKTRGTAVSILCKHGV